MFPKAKSKPKIINTIYLLHKYQLYSKNPEKRSLAEIHDKDFKIPIVNMLKDLKKNMNKYLMEDQDITYSWIKYEKKNRKGE